MPVRNRTESLRLAGLAAGAVAALLLSGCGGAPDRAATAADEQPITTTSQAAGPENPHPAEPGSSQPAEVPGSPDTPATEAASVPPTKTIIQKTITETQPIAYPTRTVSDSSLTKGVRKTRTKGISGVRTLTYAVTLTDGRQTAKKLLRSVVTRPAVTKVVAVGTKAASTCDPNYSGCVPVASDVDCAGGSGNGPAYVDGPITVIGDDVYDLDRDGDGVACDS